jgi:putative tricarboxylic transport membrane protein
MNALRHFRRIPMHSHNRFFPRATLAAALFALSHTGSAFQPTAPVEVVVHAGPGSGVDIFGRSIAAASEKEKLQKPAFRITSKTGANGALAMSYLVDKAGDPHTIGVFTTVWIATPLTSADARHTLKDLAPLAILVTDPAVAVVKSTSTYRSMTDFIDAAKKSPGKLNQAGGSFTSVDNLTRLLIQKNTGANWNLVSFPSGGQRVTSVLGEHVQVAFMQPQEVTEHLRAGTLRMIASLTSKRLAPFPDVPTLGEQGIDIPIPQQVRGVVAPPGLAKDATAYWDDFLRRLVETPTWKKYVQESLFEARYVRGAELERLLNDETNSLRVLLKEAGTKVVR